MELKFNKICFYLESYYVGGLDTFTSDLLNNWPCQDDQLYLICNNSHTAHEFYKSNIVNSNVSIEYHNLVMIPDLQCILRDLLGSGLFYKISSFLLQYVLFIYYVFVCYKKLGLFRFDNLMIINGGYPAGPSCRAVAISWGIFSKKKSIHNFHNFAVPPKKVVYIFEYIIDYFVRKYTFSFVSVSKSCSQSLNNRPALSGFSNLKFIYNGINQLISKPKGSIRSDLGLDSNCKVCLILATYEKRKGHNFLFHCFKEILKSNSNVVLITCGYGSHSDIESVRNMAKLLNISDSVYILNFRNDAMNLLIQSDVVLISSQSFESFGLTAVEAMKHKKVVVSTNSGGLAEVIKDDCGGYLFNIDDVEGYSRKVCELLNDEKLRIFQGQLGYERFKSYFTIDRVALEYYNLINKII